MNYKEYFVDLLNPSMNSILSLVESLNVELYQVGHDIVEHKEASCLIYLMLFASIDQVENWSKHFVHSLHVCCFGIELSIYEEYATHVIASISFPLFFFMELPKLHNFRLFSFDHPVPLFPRIVGKGYHNRFYFFGEK